MEDETSTSALKMCIWLSVLIYLTKDIKSIHKKSGSPQNNYIPGNG
jgi:hypothetical protein